MKVTIKELIDKINDITRVIDALDAMTEHKACTEAMMYLDDYLEMLKDIKVDV